MRLDLTSKKASKNVDNHAKRYCTFLAGAQFETGEGDAMGPQEWKMRPYKRNPYIVTGGQRADFQMCETQASSETRHVLQARLKIEERSKTRPIQRDDMKDMEPAAREPLLAYEPTSGDGGWRASDEPYSPVWVELLLP
ncbi:hypothetical protein B0H14DRAFT_2569613 [Mycena olivaceomarginata]|nr:hypothetical protein B0H14DRAFT_2569613 [Mycena olivaceomarginata]